MHDLANMVLLWVTTGLPRRLADSGTSNLQVAIVTTVGVVIAAAITALASKAKKEPTPSPATPLDQYVVQYISTLEHDRNELLSTRDSYQLLRDAVWDVGIDPDELIARQREQE